MLNNCVLIRSTNGDNFYVVESGDFDIFVNGNKVICQRWSVRVRVRVPDDAGYQVGARGPGDNFGEKALL